ncbi:hypothetical protein BVRB_9g217860 isoform A [Beta vulgaris subsp. vulgaris]|nr:hypothetical protein BVRB_9g217860 isoform A [Beta vulgaris subsp. vulgaris]
METTQDEPVTPMSRLFLQPDFNQTINCAIGFKHPLDTQSIKAEISNSLMVKHPRFSSLFVVDKHGREFWRRTQINIDDHIIIHPKTSTLDYNLDEIQEEKINAILSDIAISSPLSNEKPLWEIHLINDLRCAILRIHHSLGDGISLMSLFLASCKSCDDDNDGKDGGFSEKNRGNRGESETMWRENWLMRILKVTWWTTIYVLGFIGRGLWVRDKKTAVRGGDGVELWPRMVATAKFNLQDMKTVKTAIPNATINDVLFGILSSGFSKYLDIRSSHALQEGLQITGLAMVNLRKQPGLQMRIL